MAAAPTAYPSPSTYWSVLFETLSVVFNIQDASDLVATVRQQVQKASPEEQLLFFHAEPFDVALDLTGTNPSSAVSLIPSYLQLLQQMNWGA